MTKTTGDGEFSGGGGLIQKHKLDNGGPFTGVEEVWTVYASDVDSTDDADPRRVGNPANYNSGWGTEPAV